MQHVLLPSACGVLQFKGNPQVSLAPAVGRTVEIAISIPS